MTLSLLVNNGRLTLAASGKLPKTTDCCCDTPPKLCLCPDLCVYKLAMTSPTTISTQFTCDPVSGTFGLYSGVSLHPLSFTGWTLEPPLCTHGTGTNFFESFGNGDGEYTEAIVLRTLGYFSGTILHQGTFFKCFDDFVSFQGATYVGAFSRYSVQLEFKADCRYNAKTRSNGFFVYHGRRDIAVSVTPVPALGQGLLSPIYSKTLIQQITDEIPLASSCKPYNKKKFCIEPPDNIKHELVYLNGDVSIEVPSFFTDFTTVFSETIDQSFGWPNNLISTAASSLNNHCESASASFTISSRQTCANECCCKADGTIIELQPGEECDGTGAAKPAETCDFYGVLMTITVDGVSGTASVDDWAAGEEPIFSGGGFTGAGAGALPNGKFIQTLGSTSCDCNLRSIYLDINYSGECFLSLRINECTNVAVVELDPSSTSCTNPPEIGCTVEWNPAP